MQTCGKCKECKVDEDFAPSRRGKSGSTCRACEIATQRAKRAIPANLSSGLQTCPKCNEEKPHEEFSESRQGRTGHWCRSCITLNANGGNPYLHALKKRAWLYNVSVETLVDMLVSQKSKCAICTSDILHDFHVDHNKNTGTVRGLLCGKCNRGIGLLDHDVDRLMSAAAYLMREANVLTMFETETK